MIPQKKLIAAIVINSNVERVTHRFYGMHSFTQIFAFDHIMSGKAKEKLFVCVFYVWSGIRLAAGTKSIRMNLFVTKITKRIEIEAKWIVIS